jgi:hypothetical protein
VPAVVELHDQYVAGKRSHGFGCHLANEEKPEPEPIVTLVAPGEIDRFIGAETYAERLRLSVRCPRRTDNRFRRA